MKNVIKNLRNDLGADDGGANDRGAVRPLSFVFLANFLAKADLLGLRYAYA